jgi:hypothetical protein
MFALNFYECGASNFSDWTAYPERFKNIFKILGSFESVKSADRVIEFKDDPYLPEGAQDFIAEQGITCSEDDALFDD